jgi:ring-1,2-phenylacetyl-CoA epoxidase subunit PaaA
MSGLEVTGVVAVEDNVSATSHDPRLARRVERWDDLSDEYRGAAARIAAFQALAELVGVLPFAEWLGRVPDYVRKQMFLAKIQDEVGHGHVMVRVAEDLGISRERILGDFVDGRTKLLNVFHYGFESWEEIGPATLLMNSAAIIQFQSLHHGTYLPYARALKKIEREEGFHYHHALDFTHEILTEGGKRGRQIVEGAFRTWFSRMLAYFGPPDTPTYQDSAAYRFGLKVDSNDVLRQRWLAKIIPVFVGLGVEIPPELVRHNAEQDIWEYATVDFDAVRQLVSNGGPRYHDWLDAINDSLERNRPYRLATLGLAS